MNILIVGGAGYVGSILRPTLEAHHRCHYLDLAPVVGTEDRTFVGDINDDALVRRSVYQMDAVVFLAMGKIARDGWSRAAIDPSFDVNVKGHYRVLQFAMRERVRQFVYASSLSVYKKIHDRGARLDETQTPDATDAYGLSKRLAEIINETFAWSYPDATLISLRLMLPRNDADWPGNEYQPGQRYYPQGPEDLRRLFLAALECRVPGAHAVQTTGDINGDVYSYEQAFRLLGWKPENR